MLIIICPHCNEYIEILEINCRIFRHAVYKSNYQQINPHSPKEVCIKLKEDDLIYGCGKPFMIKEDNIVEICDYI